MLRGLLLNHSELATRPPRAGGFTAGLAAFGAILSYQGSTGLSISAAFFSFRGEPLALLRHGPQNPRVGSQAWAQDPASSSGLRRLLPAIRTASSRVGCKWRYRPLPTERSWGPASVQRSTSRLSGRKPVEQDSDLQKVRTARARLSASCSKYSG